jgi:hypothetical protein
MGIKLIIMNEFFLNGLLMDFWNDDMASITHTHTHTHTHTWSQKVCHNSFKTTFKK